MASDLQNFFRENRTKYMFVIFTLAAMDTPHDFSFLYIEPKHCFILSNELYFPLNTYFAKKEIHYSKYKYSQRCIQ